ncbi:DUF4889 domain-containing protein [Staphylococcus muscae]|uniref:DUF4889 domain-containing protein n=1 Tax=Staphylococcus muscae TaxID=1294 RepID=A0A240C8B0_9STAP|nr:DUF4889 domain-containing protein [Staphylococcus muscae]AVQ33758.1 DUF4889 domain-containing protein [Staphylococcus muscae]PNZ06266.1 DUF4889 domain-containing protein [Staphylococcus muscae]GGA87512.1 DUF4889 domain-containing protein [Staphylococcus muscae]SNW04190.1 Uncharacterised protein [Staphylococcus muscae]
MKQKQTLGIVIIVAMLVVTAGIVIAIMMSSQKETYYGYMMDDTTAEKIVNASNNEVEEHVTLETDDQFKPQKGDFVKLIAKKGGDHEFVKQEVVAHDDIPHGLMMKIHDMHMESHSHHH